MSELSTVHKVPIEVYAVVKEGEEAMIRLGLYLGGKAVAVDINFVNAAALVAEISKAIADHRSKCIPDVLPRCRDCGAADGECRCGHCGKVLCLHCYEMWHEEWNEVLSRFECRTKP